MDKGFKFVKDERAVLEVLLDSSSDNYKKGNYVESLKINIQILEKALQIGDAKYIYKGYRYLGYDYLVMNDTVLAESNFRNAIKYAQLSGSLNSNAEIKMDLANLYSYTSSNFDKRLNLHKESIELFKQANDSIGLAKAYFNTIINCFEEEEYALAFPYIQELTQLESILDKSYSASINNFWASYYLHKKEYNKANVFSLKAINSETSKQYPVDLAEAHRQYSMGLAALNKNTKAYKHSLLYQELFEENIIEEESLQSEAIAAKYQLQQYQEDIKKAEQNLKLQEQIANNKNKLNNILIFLCALGFLLFIILYLAYQKRKELNKALRVKNQEYLEAREKSEHLSKAKSTFFSTVSHELRTPLYGVIGLSTILLEDERLKDHKKDLSSLKFSADYLLALINDVLQINKIDSNSAQDKENVFDLRELVQSILCSFEYMRLQNQNKIQMEFDTEVPVQLKGNSVRLSQVLMNLVGNACKFTENGSIIIRVKKEQKIQDKISLRFEIEDTGIGIAKEKHATIFDEFTQVENLNYAYQGTGLGLPIVKKLLKLSGSEIELKSDSGKGATFSFVLEYEVREKQIALNERKIVDSSFLKGKHILIAEDNRINQIVTKKILEKKGIHCTIAENGVEVTNEIKHNSYDLILMDLNMPVRNGFEATIAIRKFNKEIPIIALTAVEIEEVRNEIYLAGMDDIIVKPYDSNKFISTIIDNMASSRSLQKEAI